MRFENTEVFNIEGALRGMRNPLQSWHKGDSIFSIGCDHECHEYVNEVAHRWANFATAPMEDGEEKDNIWDETYEERLDWLYENGHTYLTADHHSTEDYIGPNDMDLARRLGKAGPEHRKYLRQIFVSVDITAPLYWWKEADTYKVGTTANSTSTMHKLSKTPITLECFELDDFDPTAVIATQMEDIPNNILYDFIEYLEGLRQKYLETEDKKYWKELVRWLPNGWLQTRTWTANYEVLRNMYHQRAGHKLSEWRAFCEWCEQLPYAKELIID